jgi:undecaprenyl diphosphate synthase
MNSLRETVRNAAQAGVKYLTVYAFSTENWGRPQAEVDALMELICKGVEMETPELAKVGIRVRVIGDRARFSAKVQASLEKIESQTAAGETMTFVLALNYSSRSEITAGVRNIAERVARGEMKVEDISEQTITESLYTWFMPDPDLIIRTSGECRLSNFLMWQASYAEFYFTPTLWPDFDKAELDKALEAYAARDRRYGLVK